MAAALKGKVLTVLGPISPDELKITQTHEHILVQCFPYLTKPNYTSEDTTNLEVKLDSLGKIRYYPFSVRSNLILDSVEDAISELKLYKAAGGSTVCDVTSIGLRLADFRPEDLQRISRESGVNIVTGTAFYLDSFQTEETKQKSVQEISDIIVKEVCEGIGESGVRCGVIGEVGCSSPLTDFERKSLQAAALAQQRTGAPLIIHPGRNKDAPFQLLDILEAAGADISRTAMSHLDRCFQDTPEMLLEFAKRGCYLEYDMFGLECSHYQLRPDTDFLNDAQRVQCVKQLVDAGYADRVLLALDVHLKHRLTRYGGHGYTHLLEHIVPKMVDRGIPRETVMNMLIENPKRWLKFV